MLAVLSRNPTGVQLGNISQSHSKHNDRGRRGLLNSLQIADGWLGGQAKKRSQRRRRRRGHGVILRQRIHWLTGESPRPPMLLRFRQGALDARLAISLQKENSYETRGDVKSSPCATRAAEHHCHRRWCDRRGCGSRRRRARLQNLADGTARFWQGNVKPQHQTCSRRRALPGERSGLTDYGSTERKGHSSAQFTPSGERDSFRRSQLLLVGRTFLWHRSQTVPGFGREVWFRPFRIVIPGRNSQASSQHQYRRFARWRDLL